MFWCHDGVLLREGYQHLGTIFPWSELRKYNTNATYVAITKYRQDQFSNLFAIGPGSIHVVPNGIEPIFDEQIETLMAKIGINWDDFIIVSPVRIVERKNLEFAIEIFSEIKKKIPQAKYIITGSVEQRGEIQDPYFESLQDLVKSLRVVDSVLFIYPYCSLQRQYSDTELEKWSIADVYAFTDLIFLTSTEEGFGLPIIEAAVRRIPVAASNIPPFI